MPEWTANVLDAPGMQFVRIEVDGTPVSRRDLFAGLRDEPGARAALSDTIARAPFAALFWETPPLAPSTARLPAEMVLIDAPPLARIRADADAFAGEQTSGAPISVFSNLGGDARLVVPAPLGPVDVYGHLSSFVRRAPSGQLDALWRALGSAVLDHLGPAPLWVSTAGLGVSWLHIRLDTRPKYYRHQPYREPPPASG